MNIGDKMVVRAGLTSHTIGLGSDDPGFTDILGGMSYVHQGKEVLYGKYLETHGSDPEMFALMEHFADIKRKFVRAEQFMKKRMDGKDISIDELFDTYSDLAIYGALGVQLVQHLIERGGE